MTRAASLVVLASVAMLAVVSAQSSSFDVASIKPSNPDSTAPIGMVVPALGRLTATNATLRRLVYAAYKVQPFQVVGGPAWLNNEKFDINARALGASATTDQLLELLKTLLADRFKLRVHTETRDISLYALTLRRTDGRIGEKLRQSTTLCPDPEVQEQQRLDALAKGTLAPPTPGETRPCSIEASPSSSLPRAVAIKASGQTMRSLAETLTQFIGRSVVDKTGLTGLYDFELTVSLETIARLSADYGDDRPRRPEAPSEVPGLMIQLQEDLGLKLDSARGPGEVLIIDSAERPMPD